VSEPLPSVDNPVVPAAPSEAPRRAWPLRQIFTAALLLLIIASLAMAWSTQQRLRKIEQELVRRQQDSQNQSEEARLVAKQAQDSALESAAKVALLEARLAEVTLQRSQLEDLIQSLSRSRDENVLGDIDAAVRVAQQQAALTGSVEPLVSALKQADERLARHNQPRLERVRRAVARDLDRVKAVSVSDVSALGIKLDEAVRLVDELPLLSQAVAPKSSTRAAALAPGAAPAGRSASPAAPAPSAPPSGWANDMADRWSGMLDRVWNETRSLVRVTRIEHPEAMLMAPEQAFFLRENLKLRLLNARLALLSRQFESARTDLQGAEQMIDRYFDRSARRTVLAGELVRQVADAAHQTSLPRPDNTLSALAAVAAGR
jgi:uroporphyrin-3 C-methyltransferase